MYQSLYEQLYAVLQSKYEEIQLYGYEDVTIEQIWQFCVEKKWRKRSIETLRIHEMVATIFSVTASELMQYAQVKQSHQQEGLVKINVEELELLMRRNDK